MGAKENAYNSLLCLIILWHYEQDCVLKPSSSSVSDGRLVDGQDVACK